MQVLLLSGGSGKRLWPLSNEVRSKQFLKVLKNPEGQSESMVQRVYRQIREAGITSPITIATNDTQEESLLMQLGSSINLVLEPERRDTFPAIALACTYLYLEKKLSLDEVIVVLPVDVYADLSYFTTLLEMERVVQQGEAQIALMGIHPDSPSEKYGYILPGLKKRENVYDVQGFSEKPDYSRAERLVKEGAFWNGGVFAFSLGYIINNESILPPCSSYKERYDMYGTLKKTSFDYEVVEKCSSLAMVPYSGAWKDLGSWSVLTGVLEDACVGAGIISEDQGNTHVFNELDIPVLALGTKNLIVSASYDGILVADLDHCNNLKQHAQELSKTPRYTEYLWGSSQVVDNPILPDGYACPIRRLQVNSGTHTEILMNPDVKMLWIVLSGTGKVLVDDKAILVESGDMISIPKGVAHQAFSTTDLVLLEVPNRT
jgi:mannose-1-phosphate guanylyltransferase